jgi:hypothetical protein
MVLQDLLVPELQSRLKQPGTQGCESRSNTALAYSLNITSSLVAYFLAIYQQPHAVSRAVLGSASVQFG